MRDTGSGADRPEATGRRAAALPRAAGARTAGTPAGRASRRRREAGGLARQLPYLLVLAGVIAGLTVIWQGQQHVRAGTLTVAGSLLAAALARLTLPERLMGMLATRRRYIDVTALAILAAGLLVVGLVLPVPS